MGESPEDEDGRSEAEREFLEQMVEKRSAEWVEGREELILAQARLVGAL